MEQDPSELFDRVIREDGRYPVEAYQFLHAGLERASRLAHGEPSGDEPRHVTGRQLCEGLRDLAIERWGMLARTVLAHWRIHRTRDFGEMVFLLVEHGLMGKQDSDTIEDFDEVYSFAEAFGRYRIPIQTQRS